jgi:hypothetical protein
MPNAPDHLDPKEATEARLCAYLEGELSPEDRVDIEKHLTANPQHRQLLKDLAETRGWMRTIPKESAPSELAEAFAAQMERSLLLDEPRERGNSTINRLPQYALLAAILLLTLGLGVLIAVMLRGGQSYTIAPPPKGGDGSMAVTKVPASAPIGETLASDASKPAATVLADRSIVMPPVAAVAARPVEPKTVDQLADRGIPGAAPAPPSMVPLARAAALAATRPEELRVAEFAGIRRRIGLIVSTPNPDSTAEQVKRFFTSNQLVFEQEAPASQAREEVKRAAMPNGARASTERTALGNGGFPADSVPAQNNQHDDAPAPAGDVAPSTAPSLLSSRQEQPGHAGGFVYIGRDLTPLQVELLHGTLVTGGIDQTVKRLDLGQPAVEKPVVPQATVADATPITRGQSLTITVPQLVGPGIERTNVVKVADDGTISLPMLDPIPATGSSATELQSRIAAKYREANLIPAATVVVVVNTPATRPATQAVMNSLVKSMTAHAASQPTTITKAGTQPAVDDNVDVVVYLEKAK